MDKIYRNIKIVSFVIILIFLLLIIYLGQFTIMQAQSVMKNPYNQRNYIREEKIIRGSILDRNGVALAKTVKIKGVKVREYPFGKMFFHSVGYTSKKYGKTGIEQIYNSELTGYNSGVVEKITSKLTNDEARGENVELTLDSKIQKAAYDSLGSNNGAIVVLNPNTGEVLAMVSKPAFDPNNIDSMWKQLRDSANSQLNSPFYNRALQGLYPPGSTFKIITASAAYKYVKNINSFTYNCKGVRDINGYKLKCYKSEVHGIVDIGKALMYSCNTAFAGIGMEVGSQHLISEAEKFGFNSATPFDMPVAKSSIQINSSSIQDLAQSSIGQGKTLATPFQMALVAAAVAKNGIMMKPYILKSMFFNNLPAQSESKEGVLRRAMTPALAAQLKNLMINVVNSGTGKEAMINGVTVAGKTGTAEVNDGTHAWFIGFAPAENPKVAVSVLVEKTYGSGGTIAAPIAKNVIKAALGMSY